MCLGVPASAEARVRATSENPAVSLSRRDSFGISGPIIQSYAIFNLTIIESGIGQKTGLTSVRNRSACNSAGVDRGAPELDGLFDGLCIVPSSAACSGIRS